MALYYCRFAADHGHPETNSIIPAACACSPDGNRQIAQQKQFRIPHPQAVCSASSANCYRIQKRCPMKAANF
jgi:hypothetical protein